MNRPRVVAIDGAAGSGKSTLARALATALDLPYVNTGLMYRALTLAALRQGVATDDGDRLAWLMRTLSFRVGDGAPGELSIEGSPPSDELRSSEVEAEVSSVAGHPQVRRLMREEQRRLGADGAVMEGRDIGSVVFPDAPVKLYLQAHHHDRASRRAGERPSDDASVARQLAERDRRDAGTVPFVPPSDAVVIDTGALDAEQTLREALRVVGLRAPELIR
jgi:cytidylate kinase